jgi:integrase
LTDPEHGSWYFTAQQPATTTGKARVRRGGHRTAEQAAQAREKLLAPPTPVAQVTVEQWLRTWLQDLPGQVRRSTAANYRIHVNYYLIPHLGQHTLTELRPRDIEAMFTTIAAQPLRSGGKRKATTLHRIRATLRRALNMAIRDQLIQSNPARLVIMPRAQRHRPLPWTKARTAAWQHDGQRPTVAVWTPAHLAAFLAHVRDDSLFPLIWLTALRGLRRGELCGLRWIDVDLDDGALTVNQHVAHANGHTYLDTPKTAAGQRTIALDTATTALLRHHEHHQRQLRNNAGTGWDPAGRVFTRADGQPVRPDWLTHRFAALVTASGLPPVRLHDLRHGAATIALGAHADLKIVQDMLGHTSYAFTADTYATVLPETARRAAESSARTVLNALRAHDTQASVGRRKRAA